MRLLQLTSSNSSFNTINFNEDLSIVVGTQLSEEQKKSINGIGKSMSLNLIHYMFGGSFSTTSEKKLKEFLSKYGTFSLHLKHSGEEYTIKKDFSKPEYYINGDKVLQKDYSAVLKGIFLTSGSPIKFKSIFNCFARRHSNKVSYYSNILTQQGMLPTDYYQQKTNLFLLGIDISLVEESCIIKEKIAKLKKAQDTVSEYESALDKANINDIKDERLKLEQQLKEFIIAENYNELKSEADELTNVINDFRNKIYYDTKKLKIKQLNFEKSEYVDVDVEKIETLFNEANFFFEQKISKRLDEAQKFHSNLLENRRKRLKIEIATLEVTLDELEKEMSTLSEKRDSILKDLNSKGALEERDSIKDRIKTLEEEEKDLEKYEHILNEFKKDSVDLELENAAIKKKSLIYLDEVHDYLVSVEISFRNLVKEFYDNQGGSFKIEESPKAKYLFNINTHIPKEDSQGVGEVKIFCYDILLYLLNKDLLGFLAHDGCLFSEMDRRQQATIFKIIVKLVKEEGLQYYLNIGDSTLNSILEDTTTKILSDEEKEFIKSKIVLELYDDKEENWLFGKSFD